MKYEQNEQWTAKCTCINHPALNENSKSKALNENSKSEALNENSKSEALI